MLSLHKCREILGAKCVLSDSELELLRDQMYGLADIAIATVLQKIYLLLFSPFDLVLTDEFIAVTIVEA